MFPSSWRRTWNRYDTSSRVEKIGNIMRVADGYFSIFGLPSTKSGKTNGVLVEGDFARRLRTDFSTFAKFLRLLKKFFSNRYKIEYAKNLHSL
jgi:hypothetical protein